MFNARDWQARTRQCNQTERPRNAHAGLHSIDRGVNQGAIDNSSETRAVLGSIRKQASDQDSIRVSNARDGSADL